MEDGLQKQIEAASRKIATDSYAMSIGELMNMYKDGEIDIHPEFQRAFRWEINQKSTLIESILLGIPIPPIFIFHRSDGIWDVIDGQQRLSSIFQFAGIYKNEEGETQPKIKLTKTKFLSKLDGLLWESDSAEDAQLSQAQRLLIKRAKIDIKLLKATSDSNAKYDLFQRLNSGGTHLSPQEVRTCLIIMENKGFYETLKQMSQYPPFREVLPLTDRAIQEQEDLEFVVRFIVARNCIIQELPSSLHEFLDDSIVDLIHTDTFSIDNEKATFEKTFLYLSEQAGSDCFRRYNTTKKVFEGAVTISAYETMAPAVSKNLDYYKKMSSEKFREKIVEMHNHPEYAPAAARRSTDRFKALLKVGADVFNGKD